MIEALLHRFKKVSYRIGNLDSDKPFEEGRGDLSDIIASPPA